MPQRVSYHDVMVVRVIMYYKRRLESRDAEELRATVWNAAERLGEAGERYAQLLGEKDVQEREGVVNSIRSRAEFIQQG